MSILASLIGLTMWLCMAPFLLIGLVVEGMWLGIVWVLGEGWKHQDGRG